MKPNQIQINHPLHCSCFPLHKLIKICFFKIASLTMNPGRGSFTGTQPLNMQYANSKVQTTTKKKQHMKLHIIKIIIGFVLQIYTCIIYSIYVDICSYFSSPSSPLYIWWEFWSEILWDKSEGIKYQEGLFWVMVGWILFGNSWNFTAKQLGVCWTVRNGGKKNR